MAEIKDGVFGFVSGTVGRSFTTKNGGAFEIEVKDSRSTYPDRWTVWGDLGVSVGERVTVKGWLSASAETFEKEGVVRAAARRGVNKPELVERKSGVPDSAAPWGADDETPF